MNISELPFVSGSQASGDLNLWDVRTSGVTGEALSVTGRNYANALTAFCDQYDCPFLLGNIVQQMIRDQVSMGPIETSFFHHIAVRASR